VPEQGIIVVTFDQNPIIYHVKFTEPKG